MQILERGGNAIDAAIAANATIGLMEPTGNGIGGDLFIIYYEAKTGTVHGLNSSGWAPTGLTAEFLAVEGHHEDAAARHLLGDRAGRRRRMGRDAQRGSAPSRSPSCWRRPSTTPRTGSRSRRRSRRGWARLGEDAQRASRTRGRPTSIDGERAPKAGEVFRNPDLAGSLRLIAEKGRDGYYKGKTAEAILPISREQGGTFTAADLAEFQPEWVTPIKTSYRGWNVYEIGPQHPGHRRADDAEPDGAVPDGGVRLPQHQRAARDDRGEEARLRRHAALRRRSAVLARSRSTRC